MTQYFRPRNWERFQHYSKRTPPWIKLHRSLLRDHDFLSLTEIQQAHLMKIWLLYADVAGPLPRDPKWIAGQLQANPSAIGKTLKALEKNDFIELCDKNASKVLAANTETEEETEEEKKETPTESPKKSPSVKRPRGTRLPANWQPNAEMILFATQRGWSEKAALEMADNFRDYWTARSDKGAAKLDWMATWRNWVRNQRCPANQTADSQPPDWTAEGQLKNFRKYYQEQTNAHGSPTRDALPSPAGSGGDQDGSREARQRRLSGSR